MKIKVQANELADLVNVCSMAISAKPMKPIYECVHLSAKSEEGIPTLTMVGKDVGTAIRKVTDRAVVEEDGEALIPARKLLSYLKLMDGEISLNVDEKFSATLKEKGKKVTILCMNPEEYEPGLTEMENAQEYGWTVSTLKR
jgi:DNA polymerase III sliding clamp (beta) subunit (PCNA family)